MEGVFQSLLLAISLLPLQSCAQNNGILYSTPADSKDGAFVFPRAYPLTFREGSSINISWTTNFPSVNLFYYQRGKVATSIQLATNQAISWYQWTVRADETNLTEPFVFRAVNAGGTEADAKIGGFWSASYYISRTSGPDTSSISTPPAIQSSLLSSSSIGNPALSVFSSSATQQTPSTSALQSTATQSSSSATPTSLASPLPSSSVSQGAVIGLATGLSAAFVIIIGILGTVFWRRRKQRQAKPVTPPVDEVQGKYEDAPKSGYYTPAQHEVYVRPEEMEGSRRVFELPTEKGMPRIGA